MSVSRGDTENLDLKKNLLNKIIYSYCIIGIMLKISFKYNFVIFPNHNFENSSHYHEQIKSCFYMKISYYSVKFDQ